MRTRLALVTAVAVGLALGTTAQAGTPKSFSKTVAFTDGTPDPTGNTGATNQDHCSGVLPKEKPIEVKIPGPGTIDISIEGFQGDWALQILQGSEIIAGDDVNPPSYEATSLRVKKATTLSILPCNLEGTPQAMVKYSYTYKKK